MSLQLIAYVLYGRRWPLEIMMYTKHVSSRTFEYEGGGRLTLCGLPVYRYHPLSTFFHSIVVVMTLPVIRTTLQPENYAKALVINSFGFVLAFTFRFWVSLCLRL